MAGQHRHSGGAVTQGQRRVVDRGVPGRDGSITFNALAKTTLQLAAKPTMRGRVMGLWALAWLGSTPIGGPVMGWAGQVAGARWSLVIGGLATLACGILALPALTRIDRRRSQTASPEAGREPMEAQLTESRPRAARSAQPGKAAG